MDFRKHLRLNAEIDRFAKESLLRLGITVLFRQAKPFTQRCDQRGLTWVARSAGRRACHHQSAISASVWERISQKCCRSIPSSWPAHPQTRCTPGWRGFPSSPESAHRTQLSSQADAAHRSISPRHRHRAHDCRRRSSERLSPEASSRKPPACPSDWPTQTKAPATKPIRLSVLEATCAH